jgi:ABC-type antimicrobial peptide transport system permease subunit
VANAKYTDPANTEGPRPLFFVPLAQRVHYQDAMMQWVDNLTHIAGDAVLQIHGSPEGLESRIRKTLSDVDPNITLLSIQPLADQVGARFDQQRVVAQMAGLFGILALILAAVGLYGVTAYSVERRTSEIGVRMALGADRANVVRLVLRGAFLQIVIGLLIGIPASIGCAHLIAAQLYHVRGWDPVVLAASIVTLGVCALVASILPALRAASINPVQALRTE